MTTTDKVTAVCERASIFYYAVLPPLAEYRRIIRQRAALKAGTTE